MKISSRMRNTYPKVGDFINTMLLLQRLNDYVNRSSRMSTRAIYKFNVTATRNVKQFLFG